jgi:hypothetical protein
LPDLITILVIFIFNSIKGFTPNVNWKRNLELPDFIQIGQPTPDCTYVLFFAFMLIVIFLISRKRFAHFRGVSVFLGFLFTFGSAGSLSYYCRFDTDVHALV